MFQDLLDPEGVEPSDVHSDSLRSADVPERLKILVIEPGLLAAETIAFALRRRLHAEVHVGLSQTEAALISASLDADLAVTSLNGVGHNSTSLDGLLRLREEIGIPLVMLVDSAEMARRISLRSSDATVAVLVDAGMSDLVRAIVELTTGSAIRKETARSTTPEHPCSRLGLTPREREVLAALLAGDGTAEMAERLGIRAASARTYVQRVLTTLGVHSRAAAVARAVELGLITKASVAEDYTSRRDNGPHEDFIEPAVSNSQGSETMGSRGPAIGIGWDSREPGRRF